MTDDELTRRSFVTQSALAAAAAFPLGSPRPPRPPHPASLKVVCVGAHPDDPESGCGGTLARYSAAGHRVTIIYLTRGERGIPERSLEEAARLRTAEAQQACKILGATPAFAEQIDGATEVNSRAIDRIVSMVKSDVPNALFTHWPVDSHPDHQAASMLAMRAWYALKQSFPVYFFEVDAGSQTIAFRPDVHVDISATRETKRRALVAHESQRGDDIYRRHHEPMDLFGGCEIGTTAAEAFIRLDRSGDLPQIR